jgi:hypothetical protein
MIPRGGMVPKRLVDRNAGVGAEHLADGSTWLVRGNVIEAGDRPCAGLREHLLDQRGPTSHMTVERGPGEADLAGDEIKREPFAADDGQVVFGGLEDLLPVLAALPYPVGLVIRVIHN